MRTPTVRTLALLTIWLPLMAATQPSAIRVKAEGQGGAAAQAGAPITLTVTAKDPATGYALTSMAPALWLVPDDGEAGEGQCARMVNRLAGSAVPPEGTADANGFDLIQATEDGKLVLVDPLLNLASANIRSILDLGGPATSWALMPSGERLAVARAADKHIRIVDLTRLVVEANLELPSRPSALGSDGARLLAGSDDGQLYIITDPHIPPERVALGSGPVLLAPDKGLVVAVAASGRGSFVHQTGDRRDFGVTGPVRAITYVAMADAAFVLSDDGRTLSVVPQDDPSQPTTIALEKQARGITQSPDGRWVALVAADGTAVTIFDVADRRPRWTIAANDPVTEALFSDRFLYLAHKHQGGATRVVFDPLGGPPGTVTIAAGSNREESASGGPLPLMATIPGAGMLVASHRDRAAFMVNDDNAQAAMSSLPLRAGAPVGILLRYRGLEAQEEKGVYRARAIAPRGGNYLAVVRLSQPDMAGCVPIAIKPAVGEVTRVAAAPRDMIVRSLSAPSALPPGRQLLRFGISGPPVSLLGANLVGSGWQQVPADIRSAPDGYQMDVDLPAAGDFILFVRYRDANGEEILNQPIQVEAR